MLFVCIFSLSCGKKFFKVYFTILYISSSNCYNGKNFEFSFNVNLFNYLQWLYQRKWAQCKKLYIKKEKRRQKQKQVRTILGMPLLRQVFCGSFKLSCGLKSWRSYIGRNLRFIFKIKVKKIYTDIMHYPIPNNNLLSFNSCIITWRARSIF